MRKLQEIAADYDKVKDYVCQRYGGIGSLSKIYPGYTVQNEMTESGLRARLGLPSVYFYLAVFDALGDIRGRWAKTKVKILQLVGRNANLTEEEKHYIRFLLKVNNAFTAVLNEEQATLPKEIRKKQEELASRVDAEKLHRYLRRQVRKYQVKARGQDRTSAPASFTVAERAYRYGEKDDSRGIYIATKENRKRIFVPLTDGNQYKRQLQVRLYPDKGSLEIMTAVDVTVHPHEDYEGVTAVAMGMFIMLTTQDGHRYGEELGTLQTGYAEWIRQQAGTYSRNRADNPGRKKYNAKKSRLEERLHSYINQELNRFLRTEKPGTVYIVKMPGSGKGGVSRKVNQSVSMWQRGYIRKRLEQKCREQSVELVEVLGRDISRKCSNCGAIGSGSRKDGTFQCSICGYRAEEKTNTARNVLKRGMAGLTIHKSFTERS